MRNNLSQRIQLYLKAHLRQKRWRRAVTVLAAMVVFCTTYALILPAVTMTDQAYCGKEEHTHGEECYASVLVCGQEESTEVHQHTDECYETRRVLICGQEEGEDHTHTDECFHEERVLVCQQSTEPEHIHTDACYERQLVCTKEEHTHTASCYSNPNADVETSAEWESTIPQNMEHEWSDRVIAVAQSQIGYKESTSNYQISDDHSLKGYTRYGAWYGNSYGDWCAMFASFSLHYAGVPQEVVPYEAGCTRWVEKLQAVGLYAEAKDYTPRKGDLIFFDTKGDGFAHHVGIVESVETDSDGKVTTVKTIEGNSSDQVERNSYAVSDTGILGYGKLPERCDCYDDAGTRTCKEDCSCSCHTPGAADKSGSQTTQEDAQQSDGRSEEQTEEQQSSEETAKETSGLLSSQGKDYEISLSWTDPDTLPEGTTLQVSEISQDSEEYTTYLEKASQELISEGKLGEDQALPFARFFDIKLLQDDTEIEPEGSVSVTIHYTDKLSDTVNSLEAVHFQGEDTEILDVSTEESEEQGTSVTHKQDSFSVVGTLGIGEQNGEEAINTASDTQVINAAEGDTSKFEHNKTIDYLNDGETNPDTSLSGEDFYRLYLDMTGKQEPIDLLIVVDASGSMNKTDMSVGSQTGLKRSTAITLFLNGSTSQKTDNGFLSYFLSLNSKNKVSVVNFYGDTTYNGRNNTQISRNYPGYTADSSILQEWTSSNSFVNCAEHTNNGTNYEAGLKRATYQLAKVSGDGQRKVMVFLSDGVPTYFEIDSNDVNAVYNPSPTGLTTANVGKRWGNGIYNNYSNYGYCKEPSKKAFDDFKTANPGVKVFTIGVSKDINATDEGGSQSPDVLKYMAEQGGGQFISVTDNMDQLKAKIESMFYPENVTITDELSKYVRYYGDQPDVKVTMTEIATGTETVLWENGENKGVTEDGKAVFDKVIYTASDTSDNPTGSTGTVKAVFASGYGLSPKYRYTLSFNVKTTQTAYTEYKNNGSSYAGVTGDDNTDYGTNTTSSNQPGFHSNTSAYVDYTVADTNYKEYYEHPVVQVKVEMGPALPETGGAALWYTIGGTLFMGASLLYGYGRRRRRRRERRLY